MAPFGSGWARGHQENVGGQMLVDRQGRAGRGFTGGHQKDTSRGPSAQLGPRLRARCCSLNAAQSRSQVFSPLTEGEFTG